MSPNAAQQQQGSDSEDVFRAVSPVPINTRSIKPSNGVATQPFPGGVNGIKGKAPMRPKRDDDDVLPTEELDAATSESGIRERAMSPEQVQARAKSPAQSVASRAVSPANGSVEYGGGNAPNIAGVLNGLGGRSSSPAIDRSKPPTDAFYNPNSPSVNGFARPGSRNGSVGNVTADLLRDLKLKEVELEAVKRQMSWMKEALSKASRSGYVYVDRDGNQDGVNGGAEDSVDGRNAELLLKFKQFKAQMQVSPCLS